MKKAVSCLIMSFLIIFPHHNYYIKNINQLDINREIEIRDGVIVTERDDSRSYNGSIEDFLKVDMRVGTIIEASVNKKAKKPAYKLKIDFGEEIGIKTSSAQITKLYTTDELIGKQIIAVVNFPPRQIADVKSEVLVLGSDSKQGVVILGLTEKVENGDKIC